MKLAGGGPITTGYTVLLLNSLNVNSICSLKKIVIQTPNKSELFLHLPEIKNIFFGMQWKTTPDWLLVLPWSFFYFFLFAPLPPNLDSVLRLAGYLIFKTFHCTLYPTHCTQVTPWSPGFLPSPPSVAVGKPVDRAGLVFSGLMESSLFKGGFQPRVALSFLVRWEILIKF